MHQQNRSLHHAEQCWVLTSAGKPVFTWRGERLSAANLRPCGFFCALAVAAAGAEQTPVLVHDGEGACPSPLTSPLARLHTRRCGSQGCSHSLDVSLLAAGELLLVWSRQRHTRGMDDRCDGSRVAADAQDFLALLRDVVWSAAPSLSRRLRRTPSLDPAAAIFSAEDRRAWRRWCAAAEGGAGVRLEAAALPLVWRRWLEGCLRARVALLKAAALFDIDWGATGGVTARLLAGSDLPPSGRARALLLHTVVEVCRTWDPVAAVDAGAEAFVPLCLPGRPGVSDDAGPTAWLHLTPLPVVAAALTPGTAVVLVHLVGGPDGFPACHASSAGWRRALSTAPVAMPFCNALRTCRRGAWYALHLHLPAHPPSSLGAGDREDPNTNGGDGSCRGDRLQGEGEEEEDLGPLRCFLLRLRDDASGGEHDVDENHDHAHSPEAASVYLSGLSPGLGATEADAYLTQAREFQFSAGAVRRGLRSSLWIGTDPLTRGGAPAGVWCCLRLHADAERWPGLHDLLREFPPLRPTQPVISAGAGQQARVLGRSVQWVCAGFAAGTTRREVLGGLARLLHELGATLLSSSLIRHDH